MGAALAPRRRGTRGLHARVPRRGGGAVTDAARAALESAAESLEELGQYKLDPVRASMLFGKLVEVYASLSRDDGKCLRAAHWCVQQACTQACVDAYAVDEASPRDAFNAAISSAVTYYRRGGDLARAEAARALANKHPAASTKYERVDQTPKVYFPGLTAQRFWEPRSFEVVRKLEAAFADESTRAAMLDDLNTLIRHNALKRLVSPSAPFRPPSKAADADGEGAWSELPLYDGREWDGGRVLARRPAGSYRRTGGLCRSLALRRSIHRPNHAERRSWPRYCVSRRCNYAALGANRRLIMQFVPTG